MGRLFLFLLPQSFSLLGSSIAQFGIIWTLTLDYSSGTVLLLASLAAFIPQIILMLASGILTDRGKRKRTIIISDTASALMALFLAFATMVEEPPLWVYLSVLFVRSGAAGLQTPAAESAIPFIAAGNLERANGLKGLLSSVVMLLSPALSGILLPHAGLQGLMLVDCLTAAVAVAFLLPQRIPEMTEASSHLPSFAVFLHSERSRIPLRLLLFHAVALVLISPGAALTPLLVTENYSASSSSLAVSESAYSLGMVAGGVGVSVLGKRSRPRASIGISLAVYALMLIGMALADSFMLYAIMNCCIGVVSPVYTASMSTSLQMVTDKSMMGRVMSLFSIISSSVIPLGLLAAAPLADIFSVQVVFCFAGVLTFFYAAVGSRIMLRSL